MNTNLTDIENRLWSAADELRANSCLKASEYSTPVLGLIFLRYADHKFTQAEQEISSETDPNSRRHPDLRMECQARGVLYLLAHSRFQYLLSLPEGENIGQAVTDAMKAIETENSQIEGVLPKTYNRLEKNTLLELLRIMEQIPMDIEGDAFGKVYEYFLGNFAMSEGQRGGEFFTPTSLVKLIVEIIQPSPPPMPAPLNSTSAAKLSNLEQLMSSSASPQISFILLLYPVPSGFSISPNRTAIDTIKSCSLTHATSISR